MRGKHGVGVIMPEAIQCDPDLAGWRDRYTEKQRDFRVPVNRYRPDVAGKVEPPETIEIASCSQARKLTRQKASNSNVAFRLNPFSFAAVVLLARKYAALFALPFLRAPRFVQKSI